MKIQNVAIGTVVTVFVLFFLFFLLRGCSGSTAQGSITASLERSSSDHLSSCTADRATGLCYPQAKNDVSGFDQSSFMAMVMAHQLQSSSSSSRGGIFSGGGFLPSLFRRGSSNSSSSRSSMTDAASSSRSVASEGANATDTRGGVTGESDGSAESAFDAMLHGDGMSDSAESANDTFVEATSGEIFIPSSSGEGALPSGRCHGRSVVDIFDSSQYSTGSDGSTIPRVIDGDCPIAGAVLKGPQNNVFGGPLNDF